MNRTSIIYGRVSSESDRQSTDRQIYSLSRLIEANRDILVHEPFTEHISGATRNCDRPVLTQCLEYARENKVDIIYFSSLDRMGRAIWQVLETVKFCLDHRINCYFQKRIITWSYRPRFSRIPKYCSIFFYSIQTPSTHEIF